MKRLLLPALAIPTAVNAESHWLILHWYNVDNSTMEKVQVQSADACMKEGRKWEESTTHGYKSKWRRFHCVVGK